MGKNRIKTVRAGRLVYAVCYSQAAPSESAGERGAKRKLSSAARQRLNFRAAWQKLELEIAANFGPRDLFITLTYDEGHLPEDRDGAIAQIKKFIVALRRIRRCRGEVLKYIYTTEEMPDETGGAKRLHHHIIINAASKDLETVVTLWGRGNVEIDPLLDGFRDSYEVRARYMVKERQPGEYGRKTGLRAWTPSRNLDKPQQTSEAVPDTVTITAPPGAYVLERHGDSNYWGFYEYVKYLLPEPRRRL